MNSKVTVSFAGPLLEATVTNQGYVAAVWIAEIKAMNFGNTLIVGLDIEWEPNTIPGVLHKVALLQLCVGTKCLVFQIIHADYIPPDLNNFLLDSRNTFVGCGIAGDVAMLQNDYGLECRKSLDLGDLAVNTLGRAELLRAGIKGLAREILGIHIEKPEMISRSNWALRQLTLEQINYACIDSYVSFAVGNQLLVSK